MKMSPQSKVLTWLSHRQLQMEKYYRLKRKKKNLSPGLIAANISSRVENVKGWTAAKIYGEAKSSREILCCINKLDQALHFPLFPALSKK